MKFVTKWFRLYDALFLVIAILLVVIYVGMAGSGFPLDDSWIHQVYGRNLAQTGQWAFVPGEPSAASTSPLYTVLLAVGYKLGVPYTVWTHALGALALALAGIVGARLAERLSPGVKYSGLIAGLALVGAWHLVWASAAGMETMLFCMFTLIVIVLTWREQDAHSSLFGDALLRGVVFGAVAALTTLTRPEGLMLVGLAGLVMLIVQPQGNLKLLAAWVIGAALSFAVVIAPYLLLNLQLTGGLLPDTAAAKQAKMQPFLAASYPSRLWDMLFPLIAGGQLLLFPGMIYFAIMALKRLRHERSALFNLLPLLWAVGLIMLYAARLPAPYQHGRYVIPALPSLIVCGVAGSIGLFRLGHKSMAGRVITRGLMISTALLFAYFALVIGTSIYAVDVRIINEEMVASAEWIAANIQPDQLLAIHDIGAVGYFAPRPILDIAGLVSPEVVPIVLDKEGLYALMKERNARYLMAFPDQVPGANVNDPRLCPVFTTHGETAPKQGGYNMTVYILTWDGICPNQ